MQTTKKQRKKPDELLRLSKEEYRQPILVLEDFFSCYHLKDLREILWDWLLAAIGTDNGTYDRGKDRSNLIFLYEQIEGLLEATYLIQFEQFAQKDKRKKKK